MSIDGARSLHVTSDELVECGPCGYGGTHKEAIYLCEDCQDNLCDNCAESHKGLKLTRNHKLIAVQSGSSKRAISVVSSLVFCDCSQNLGVEFFCEDHNDVVCHYCQTTKHRKCKTATIDKASDNFDKTKLELTSQQVSEVKDGFKSVLSTICLNQNGLKKAKEMCQNEIRQYCQSLKEVIDKLEEKALQETEKYVEFEMHKLEKQENCCSSTEELLKKELTVLQNAKVSSNILNIFAAVVKISRKNKDYESLLKDVRCEIKSTEIKFKHNEKLDDVIAKINDLGTVECKTVPSLSLEMECKAVPTISLEIADCKTVPTISKTFVNMDIKSSYQVNIALANDKKTPSIYGCTFLLNGDVLLCDCENSSIKLLKPSRSFAITETLAIKSKPRDVSPADDTTAIITLHRMNKLQFIQTNPALKIMHAITLDKKVWGVDVVGEDIYVTCHNWPGEGEVRMLNKEGVTKRTFGIKFDGSYLFTGPYYLAVGRISGRVFVSDYNTSTVTCMDTDGSVKYTYEDTQLIWPRAVLVDDEDNIIICGEKSNNVHCITADGKKNLFLTSEAGLVKPTSVAYSEDNKLIIFGCQNQNKLFVYHIK